MSDEDNIEITEDFKRELLDRISVIDIMFDRIVVNHPAAILLKDRIDKVADEISDLYQQAGRL